jgi:WD40 repeat protein
MMVSTFLIWREKAEAVRQRDFAKEALTRAREEEQIAKEQRSRAEQFLASASEDRTVRIWDAATGKLNRCFRGHSQRVTSLAFHPDNRRIVSASGDGTIKIWEYRT